MSTQHHKQKSAFDVFMRPILENLFAPIFAYIAVFAIMSAITTVFSGKMVTMTNPVITFWSNVIAMIVLGITAVLTVVRFLSDDVLIVLGKAMQEPKIQRLKAENDRLQKRIDQIISEETISIYNTDEVFVNENSELVTVVRDIQLESREQKIFDNVLWLWDRAMKDKKITKDVMTGPNGLGMAQRQWTKSSTLIQQLQIIDEDKKPIVLDRESVVEILYEHFGGL